jgi:hypothetical protein
MPSENSCDVYLTPEGRVSCGWDVPPLPAWSTADNDDWERVTFPEILRAVARITSQSALGVSCRDVPVAITDVVRVARRGDSPAARGPDRNNPSGRHAAQPHEPNGGRAAGASRESTGRAIGLRHTVMVAIGGGGVGHR